MNLLNGSKVSVQFGGVRALSEIDFHVDSGEVVGLIGPNGAGKTTLLNAISGLCRCTGSLEFQGKAISGLRPHKIARMGIARTFQVVRPFDKLTAIENVVVGAMFSGKSMPHKHEILERARDALEWTGLYAKRDQLPRQLTLSERQRLEMARALAMKPVLLLLDEVMAGLNHNEIDKMIELINRINSSLGVTIIVVEHVMKAIMSVCRRIIVLQFGKKIGDGPPSEIVNSPDVIQAYLGKRFAERHSKQAEKSVNP